jgi:RHS repeat-associated protein
LSNAQFLHSDHLDSVRAITNSTGVVVERAVYKPFGEQTEWLSASQTAPESKGWIGERFDADAGLQYLNARYYDPVLGMFIQPDWFDVMKPGVGTNRFGYSFNDPINLADPSGNDTIYKDIDGDGYSEFYGTISYGEPGFDDDFSESGILPSEWVDSNNASKGGSVQVASPKEWLDRLPHELRFGQPVTNWSLANPSFINRHETLRRIVGDQKFYSFTLKQLEAGNYRNYNASWEMGGQIYVSEKGIRYEPQPKHATATRDGTSVTAPNARRGEIAVMFHTHPGSFSIPSGKGPEVGDLDSIGSASTNWPGQANLGLIATARGIIWGYNDKGWK